TRPVAQYTLSCCHRVSPPVLSHRVSSHSQAASGGHPPPLATYGVAASAAGSITGPLTPANRDTPPLVIDGCVARGAWHTKSHIPHTPPTIPLRTAITCTRRRACGVWRA